jgi:hypothetical protein
MLAMVKFTTTSGQQVWLSRSHLVSVGTAPGVQEAGEHTLVVTTHGDYLVPNGDAEPAADTEASS